MTRRGTREAVEITHCDPVKLPTPHERLGSMWKRTRATLQCCSLDGGPVDVVDQCEKVALINPWDAPPSHRFSALQRSTVRPGTRPDLVDTSDLGVTP